MDARVSQCAILFLLCFFCISDAGIAEKEPPKAIKETRKVEYPENQMLFPSSTATSKKDSINPENVPIIHQTTPGTNSSASGGAWCIASSTASDTALQVALDYACGYGGADCSQIQPSGPCFDPNTFRDHASYAFNDYYRRNPLPTSCDFGGTAQITNTDPSHGSCRFASASSTPTTLATIPTTTPSIPITPPSTMTPIMPYPPVGGDGFDSGSEPTGNPSAAEAVSVSLSILLLIAVNCLIFSVDVVSYI